MLEPESSSGYMFMFFSLKRDSFGLETLDSCS